MNGGLQRHRRRSCKVLVVRLTTGAQVLLDSIVRKMLHKIHPDKDKRAMGTEESTRRTQVVVEARGILRDAIVA